MWRASKNKTLPVENVYVSTRNASLKNQRFPEKTLMSIGNAHSHCSGEKLISEDKKKITFLLLPYSAVLIQPIECHLINRIELPKSHFIYSFHKHRSTILCILEDGNYCKCKNLYDAVCLLHNLCQKVSTNS